MKAAEKIEQLVRAFCEATRSEAVTDNRMDERILADALTAYKKTENDTAPKRPSVWRIAMNSRITKLAAAAVIIAAVVFGVSVFDKTTPTAYALEQTLHASHTVRWLHIKDFKAGEDEPKEFWLEFDQQGQVRNVRTHIPEWDSPSHGAKVAIWHEGKVTVWFEKKNILFTAGNQEFAKQILTMVRELDPKWAVQHLVNSQQQGFVNIETEQPSDRAEPITVTATYLPESQTPDKQLVLFVDQATTLVTAVETYRFKENEYRRVGVVELYDYNQPIAPEMFTLDDVPADVMRIDQTTTVVGLEQGDLSNEEIAAEVARQFFEALIAKDYDKAGQLYEGMPADSLQQALENIKFVRIVSIGPVGPHPMPATKGLVVPCVVEVEKDAQISEVKVDALGVRQVFNQPNRWTIFGGF